MRGILLSGILLITTSIPAGAPAQPAIGSEIAPLGKLRVAVNAGNPVLVRRTPDGEVIGGVAVEVGKFIAEKLGVSFELVPYPNSNKYTQSFGKGEWELGFAARTPLVAEKADFILDVMLFDYVFVAGPGHEFANAADVDRPGVRIGVALNTPSDQFLSRTLKSAELVRAEIQGPEALLSGKVDVLASSASRALPTAAAVVGAKIVPGAFTSDPFMVALPKGRSSSAQGKLAEIVKEAKRTGVVAKAIEHAGFKGVVRVAPD